MREQRLLGEECLLYVSRAEVGIHKEAQVARAGESAEVLRSAGP